MGLLLYSDVMIIVSDEVQSFIFTQFPLFPQKLQRFVNLYFLSRFVVLPNVELNKYYTKTGCIRVSTFYFISAIAKRYYLQISQKLNIPFIDGYSLHKKCLCGYIACVFT